MTSTYIYDFWTDQEKKQGLKLLRQEQDELELLYEKEGLTIEDFSHMGLSGQTIPLDRGLESNLTVSEDGSCVRFDDQVNPPFWLSIEKNELKALFGWRSEDEAIESPRSVIPPVPVSIRGRLCGHNIARSNFVIDDTREEEVRVVDKNNPFFELNINKNSLMQMFGWI
jgi:hypothetical protein